MIDKNWIGSAIAPNTVTIERGRLKLFLKAIGETNPVFSDEGRGHDSDNESLPVPPTFLFCMELEKPEPFGHLTAIGVDLARVLHGEQSFDYYHPVCVGDRLTFNARIVDIYEKKGGAMDFIVIESRVTNQHQTHVADLRSTIIQRNSYA